MLSEFTWPASRLLPRSAAGQATGLVGSHWGTRAGAAERVRAAGQATGPALRPVIDFIFAGFS